MLSENSLNGQHRVKANTKDYHQTYLLLSPQVIVRNIEILKLEYDLL